jgi:hypothetical protein
MDSTGFGQKAYNAAKMAAVVDVLLAEGVASSDALKGADISFDDLHLASTRISRNQLIQCYRNAVALSRDPHLPYTIGSNVHLSAYGMYGYAMLCSTDFRRTMEFAVHYHQLATPLTTIAFEERDRLGTWTIEPLLHPNIDSLLYRFVTELQIAVHISLHRDIMGESFKPREILLTYRPAADFRLPSEIIGCPVSYQQDANWMVFDFGVSGRRAEARQSDHLPVRDCALRRLARRPRARHRRGRQGSKHALARRREPGDPRQGCEAAQDNSPHLAAATSLRGHFVSTIVQ